jgi:hypothetical protein
LLISPVLTVPICKSAHQIFSNLLGVLPMQGLLCSVSLLLHGPLRLPGNPRDTYPLALCAFCGRLSLSGQPFPATAAGNIDGASSCLRSWIKSAGGSVLF